MRSKARLMIVLLLAAAVTPAQLRSDDNADTDSRSRLRGLTPSKQDELRRKKERFDKLSPEQQQRLRDLHEAVVNHPNSDQLLGILKRYSQWLRALPAGQRAELLSLSKEERLERIKVVIRQQEDARFQRLAATKINFDDRRAILAYLFEDFVPRHKQHLEESIPDDLRSRYQGSESSRARNWILLHTAIRMGEKVDKIFVKEDFADLSARLSNEARGFLDQEDSPTKKSRLIREWVRATVFSGRSSGFRSREPVPEKELKRFYETLDDVAKEHFNALPATEMKRELQRMYYFRKMFPNSRQFRFGSRGGRGGGRGRGGNPDGRRAAPPNDDGTRSPKPQVPLKSPADSKKAAGPESEKTPPRKNDPPKK